VRLLSAEIGEDKVEFDCEQESSQRDTGDKGAVIRNRRCELSKLKWM